MIFFSCICLLAGMRNQKKSVIFSFFSQLQLWKDVYFLIVIKRSNSMKKGMLNIETSSDSNTIKL